MVIVKTDTLSVFYLFSQQPASSEWSQ